MNFTEILPTPLSKKAQNQLNARLIEAAEKEDKREVKRCLAEGADMLTPGKQGNTMLHYAAQNRWEDIAIQAVQAGVAIEAKNSEGMTTLLAALHTARFHGENGISLYLLTHGANPMTKDITGACAMHYIAREKNTALMEAAIANGGDINVIDGERKPPLLWVRTYEMATYLLDHGADITFQRGGKTALHVAASLGSKELVIRLLDAGVKIEAGSPTPVFEAAAQGHKEVVDLLLERGAKLHITQNLLVKDLFLCVGGTYCTSLLHYAARENWIDIAEMLLNKGAQLEESDISFRTPLHVAAQCGQKEMVDFLLAKGASIKTNTSFILSGLGSEPTVLHYASKYGWTDIAARCVRAISVNAKDNTPHRSEAELHFPLLWAATYGQKEMVLWLLDHGADIHVQVRKHYTLLHYTALHGWTDIEERCLKAGLTFDTKKPSDRGVALLEFADCNQKILVEKLLTYEMQIVDFRDHNGKTLLHFAARHGWQDIAQQCLKAGIPLEVQSTTSLETPLLQAGAGKQKSMVEWLLAQGANIHASDNKKTTLLHHAAHHGWQDIVAECLKAHMSLETENDYNRTPLIFAIYGSQKEMVEWLLAHGASLYTETKEGRTPLEDAKAYEKEWSNNHTILPPEKRVTLLEIIALLEERTRTIEAVAENAEHAKSLEEKIATQEKTSVALTMQFEHSESQKTQPLQTLEQQLAIYQAQLIALQEEQRNFQKEQQALVEQTKFQLQATVKENFHAIKAELLGKEPDNCNDKAASPKNPSFLRSKKEWPASYHDSHRAFRQALAVFKEQWCPEPPFSCYVSFSRGRQSVTKEVTRLVGYLREAGITVHYDRNRQYTHEPFHKLLQKIQKVDFVIVVGTPSLLQQYHWQESPEDPFEASPPAQAELNFIEGVMAATPNAFKLLPVLFEKTAEVALPPFVRPYAIAERHFEQADYFKIVRNLIAAMHGIAPEDPRFKDIKQLFTKTPPSDQKPSIVEDLKCSMEDFARTAHQAQAVSSTSPSHLPSHASPPHQEIGR